nr:alpha/beta hydrolase [Sulfolobus sp. A20]
MNGNIGLFFNMAGSGKPIVLIHHLAGSYKSWKFVSPKLAEENLILVYDLRGHGRSSIPFGPYYIEDHSQDLRSLILQLRLESPILVGHSIGSLVAIDYALKYNTEKLILIGALYKSPSAQAYEKYLRVAQNFGMRALAEYRRIYKEFSEKLINNYTAWNSLLEVYEETNVLGYKYAVEGLLMAKDYSEDLKKISSKTLLIYGNNDGLISNLSVFKNNMKDIETKIIDDCGHFPNFEDPETLVKFIKNFL